MTACREVQASPHGHLDLWARYHFKSSLIAVALTIFDIMRDPEITFGIFSFKAGAAQDIVAQIKQEFESRNTLRWLFPDIIWDKPSRDATSWSIQGGITVMRKGNPRECKVEGHSYMEGAPVGKHFKVTLGDDLVTQDTVQSPEMITKSIKAIELMSPLGTEDCVKRFLGTRYHFQDPYQAMIDKGSVKVRCYPAEDEDAKLVLLTREKLDAERVEMTPLTYAAQMKLDPKMDSTAGFLEEWLRYYDEEPSHSTMNVYILVDPANEKKKTSDWTVMFVIGLGANHNYYVLDIIRDRLKLGDRARKLIDLHRKWSPNPRKRVNGIGYEKYGKDADIEAIEAVQAEETYRFDITPPGGNLSKRDRINRLEPVFFAGRVYLPRRLLYTQYDGTTVDLVHHFIQQEYKPYPAIQHDDMLDDLACILDEDMRVVWPKPKPSKGEQEVKKWMSGSGRSSWMAG